MIRKKTAANAKAKGGAVVRPKSRHEPGTRMSVLLSNPDFLLEGFIEKRCQYLGVLEDIRTTADLSHRGTLLSALDNHRNLGRLPWRLTPDHNVTVTLSAYNVKIIKENRTGSILHRLPIHEIASASYVNDDDQHFLFIMAGDATKTYCPCHVLCCAKRADAEEMCSVLQQVFQLVYTEATMEHLNQSISAGESGTQFHSPPPTSTLRPGEEEEEEEEEEEDEDDGGGGGTSFASGVTAEELVQGYMERLHKLLDFRELREFATLLKRYRDDLPVREFLTKLQKLYGEQRTFLIPDMHSFIPEDDKPQFEEFLAENRLQSRTKAATKPHPPEALQEQKRGSSEPKVKGRHQRGKHASHVTDVDKFLQDIDLQMDSILETTNF